MKLRTIAILLASAAATATGAADPAADTGAALADHVCAACHGSSGISVAAHIPNLAGQKEPYLRESLRQFRDGSRKNDIMSVVARDLSDSQLAQLAQHFASLPAGATAATAATLKLATRATFPTEYERDFTLYFTQFVADDGQIKRYFASPATVAAVRQGQPMPDGAVIIVEVYAAVLDDKGQPRRDVSGQYQRGRLLAYPVMQNSKGAGAEIPVTLRNSDWTYALFGPDRKPRANANHAECLACHKPRAGSSFMFTFDELARGVR
jgi:cytochrome c553